MNDTYRKIIDEAPAYTEKVAELFDWSRNYYYPTPATLFLDLIGYSLEEYGELFCHDMTKAISRLGYLELSMLGQALEEYSTQPLGVIEFVGQVLEAETEGP